MPLAITRHLLRGHGLNCHIMPRSSLTARYYATLPSATRSKYACWTAKRLPVCRVPLAVPRIASTFPPTTMAWGSKRVSGNVVIRQCSMCLAPAIPR